MEFVLKLFDDILLSLYSSSDVKRHRGPYHLF